MLNFIKNHILAIIVTVILTLTLWPVPFMFINMFFHEEHIFYDKHTGLYFQNQYINGDTTRIYLARDVSDLPKNYVDVENEFIKNDCYMNFCIVPKIKDTVYVYNGGRPLKVKCKTIYIKDLHSFNNFYKTDSTIGWSKQLLDEKAHYRIYTGKWASSFKIVNLNKSYKGNIEIIK